ncbi:hypothetical protein [Streptomyces sp. NPDC048269]|uniref:hypothetical protein n=1 Tax=Streptomyces sp. NPDC048269 TaxID=3155753 RepID=UPI00342B54AB
MPETGLRAELARALAERDEALREIARLRAEVDALKQPGDDSSERWSKIDYLLLEGRRIQALQRIRDEHACGIPQALELVNHRLLRLREDRPDDFVEGAHELEPR